MKRLFFAMAAMAAMLTSCSKDETTTAPVIERSKVTFTVNAPELSTRAGEGEGLSATKLEYVIYDLAESPENGANQIYGTADFSDDSDGDNNPLTTTVEVNLVEGREYEAIFFAHAEDAPYKIDWTAQTMTINHQGLTANNEKYDAFFKYVEPFEIEAKDFNVNVEMKRPFAQLNVATVDYDNNDYPAGKMIDADMTGVEVEAYKSMNLKSGNVEGAKEIIKYNVASSLTLKQNDPIKVDNVDYTWLSMNYILVNARENVGVKFYFTDKDATSTKTYTREYTQVPVERNYRTNIVGTILTSPTEFKVTIDPGFKDPAIVYDDDETTVITVNSPDDLKQEFEAFATAITNNDSDDNPAPGTYIFKIEDLAASGNYAANKVENFVTRAGSTPTEITIPQVEGYNIVIDGCGNEFDGTFYINGNSRHTGAETLTFRNINFNHAQGNIDFISCDDGRDKTIRYAHNVTVENCTFTGNANGPVVGMRFRQCYNIRVVNCEANDVFLMMWATGGSGITIDNATINVADNGEGAISLGTSTNVEINNSNITANGYGIRADGSVATKLVIENSQITANIPVLVRNTTANYEVELKGDNDFTYNGNKKYHIVFTKGGDNTYEAPESNWKLTGAEGLNVFPGKIVITNLEELKAFRDAVNAGTTYSGAIVELAANIDLAGEEWTPIGGVTKYPNPNKPSAYLTHNFEGTFDGQNHVISNLSINTPTNSNVGLFGMTTDGEIKNLIVENAKITGRLNVGVVAGQPYTSKFNNITVKGHVEVYGMSYVGGVGGKNAYADWNNVTVDVDNTSYVKANSVENGTAYRTYVGGVVGFNGEGGHTFKNITSNIDVEGSTIDVGGMFGIAHYGNNFVNCSSSGDVKITNATEAADAEEIGGIAGVWHNGGADVTFTNCSFTGNLSVNVEGVDLTDNTIVGKPYSSSGKGSLWVNGTYAYVGTEANAKKAISEEYTTIKLFAGEYLIDLYNIAERETLNIIGTEGTKVKFDNLQVRASQFKNFTIKNCEILRMPNKSWGHLVFGSGTKADGVYTVDNCIFNGQNSQGIYINENTSGATYNITNCTFDGNFGGEGAVTIQNNDGIEHTVNVKGCTFNNIPDTSHEIYILYAYAGWTLNAPGVDDIYWKANN